MRLRTDPATGRFLPTNPVERFWSHVKQTDGCWEWQAGRLLKGLPYGRFAIGGTTVQAHRNCRRCTSDAQRCYQERKKRAAA